MGIRQLEASILVEARTVTGRSKLRQKDIMAWQTGPNVRAESGETVYYLPTLGISVAVIDEPGAGKGEE